MTLLPVAFLADTSVWGRDHQPIVAQRLLELNASDDLWTCKAVDVEVAYGARSHDVAKTLVRRRLMLEAPIDENVLDRALDVAAKMALANLHRHAKPTDLIIAAAAEFSDLTVLHYDKDFDHISSVTGQPTQWVVPAGSLD